MSLTKKEILSMIKKGTQINEMSMKYDGPHRAHPDYERKLKDQDTPFSPFSPCIP